MAKINISFNNKNFLVDEDALTAAAIDLKSHLSTIMSGSGAIIKFDGVDYNVDSVKLQTATNDFVSHLGTIFGDGSKVVVNGVEYPISSVKVSGSVSELEEVLGKLNTPSTDEPTLNEYGFYYNQAYMADVAILGGLVAFFLCDDGRFLVINTNNYKHVEVGSYAVEGKNASMTTSIGVLTGTFSDDGKSIYCNELQVTAVLDNKYFAIDEDFIYVYREIPELEVAGYEVYPFDATKSNYGAIKENINGYNTIMIAEQAFLNNTNLTSIVIPDSVIAISDQAFDGCTNLTNIELGNPAFYGDAVFQNCTSLTNIVIPKGTLSIGHSVFANCTNLKTISLPDGLIGLGSRVFANCTSLSNVIIPESVDCITNSLFIGCTGLTSVTIPKATMYISAHAFSGCTSLDNIIIPNNVSAIKDYAFYNCESLTSISLTSCSSFGTYVFYNCKNLTNVTLPEDMQVITDHMFYGCSNLNIEIPDSVTSIGESAFEGCSSLTSINIPDDYGYTFGKYAFKGCSGLTSLVIPEGVEILPEGLLMSCTELMSISLPNSLTKIGESVFFLCGANYPVFNGTIEEWNNIKKDTNWDNMSCIQYIVCTDGKVTL